MVNSASFDVLIRFPWRTVEWPGLLELFDCPSFFHFLLSLIYLLFYVLVFKKMG